MAPLLPAYKENGVNGHSKGLGQLRQTLIPSGLSKRLLAAVLVGGGFVYVLSSIVPNSSPYTSITRSAPTTAFTHYKTFHDVPPNHAYPLPLDATLDQRLSAWRNGPGVGWEPADFVAWNLQTCANVIPNHNRDLIAKAALIWGVMNSTAILTHRERMAAHIEAKRDAGAFESLHVKHGGRGYVGEGRGIVFTAGNADTLSRVVQTLKLIRNHYNSKLPAAIFHFASERPADDDPIREQLAGLGAKLVQADREKDLGRTKNYHLKAQAIVEAEWAEVVYLDSDNLPTMDPEEFFNQPNYQRLGAMFWVDYWKTSANNPMWHILGVQCRDEWEQEAGQILIDKRRHLDAMLLSQYMLEDWQFWYYFSDGDKDVFRFSFLGLRKRWALPGRWVGAAGLPSATASGDFCSHTMQQFDNEGRPAFVHYNLLKQIPSGVGRGYSWGRTKQMKKYPHGDLPPTPRHGLKDLNITDVSYAEPGYKAPAELRLEAYPYPDSVVHGPTDVEADMLANAKDDGWGIQPAHIEVRRRAAIERGIRPFFHGGVISALCIDINWEDPYGKPREANTLFTEEDGKSAPNELGIDWGLSPFEIVQWTADDRLRDLEETVYDQGFVPNAKGF